MPREGIIVLTRAKREAEARLRKYESEGKASRHKIAPVQQAIKELDEALAWLMYGSNQRLTLVRLQQTMEAPSYVQISSSKANKRGRR